MTVALLCLELLGVLAVAAFPLRLMIRALKAGVWNQRGIDVHRDERPTAFWFGIVMYAVIAGIILCGPLYLGWVAFH